jgi:hypothetical protein
MAATFTRVKSLKPIRGIKQTILDLNPGDGYVQLDGIDVSLAALRSYTGMNGAVNLIISTPVVDPAVSAWWEPATDKLFLTDGAGTELGDGNYDGNTIRLLIYGS